MLISRYPCNQLLGSPKRYPAQNCGLFYQAITCKIKHFWKTRYCMITEFHNTVIVKIFCICHIHQAIQRMKQNCCDQYVPVLLKWVWNGTWMVAIARPQQAANTIEIDKMHCVLYDNLPHTFTKNALLGFKSSYFSRFGTALNRILLFNGPGCTIAHKYLMQDTPMGCVQEMILHQLVSGLPSSTSRDTTPPNLQDRSF